MDYYEEHLEATERQQWGDNGNGEPIHIERILFRGTENLRMLCRKDRE